jgi:hypothetical protein
MDFVRSLRLVDGVGLKDLAEGDFAVGYVDGDGVEVQRMLSDCLDVPFEAGTPVRSFPSFTGQRNWPGLWWSATAGTHVGYESWLERDHAMLLDFDADVVAFASQPFWLFFRAGSKIRSHAPDWFARHADGRATVIDCRPDHRIKERDAAAFAATNAACDLVEWRYRRVGEADPVLVANLRWLSGYRHPRYAVPGLVEPVLAAFAAPGTIAGGAAAVGDPISVLPVVYHLIWHHQLAVDLGAVLGMDTRIVTVPTGGAV